MSLMDALDSIVAERLRELVALGQVSYSASPRDRPKQSRSLGIHLPDADFELLSWESGEVEFIFGTVGEPHNEHLDISSETELRALVERLEGIARTWKD